MSNPWEFADILVDRLGKPIPQIWDSIDNKFVPYTDNYQGILDGSTPVSVTEMNIENQIYTIQEDFSTLKTLLMSIQNYESDISSSLESKLDVSLSCDNISLLNETIITWNGIATSTFVEIPVSNTDVLIYIDNTCDQEVTVTLEHKIKENMWARYYNGNGSEIEFDVKASNSGVYGVFQKFPKFLGGRIILTTFNAPSSGGTTTIQVQSV